MSVVLDVSIGSYVSQLLPRQSDLRSEDLRHVRPGIVNIANHSTSSVVIKLYLNNLWYRPNVADQLLNLILVLKSVNETLEL